MLLLAVDVKTVKHVVYSRFVRAVCCSNLASKAKSNPPSKNQVVGERNRWRRRGDLASLLLRVLQARVRRSS